jgi:hypothetical protein
MKLPLHVCDISKVEERHHITVAVRRVGREFLVQAMLLEGINGSQFSLFPLLIDKMH